MAKPIKIWSGTEWLEVATSIPNLSGYVTTSILSAHESDTTNVHGIADTSQLATQTYVNNQVAALVDSAPSTLDTLNELAAALGDDANFSTTVTNSIADKVSKSGGDIITVSSGSTVPLTIQNNGTGNSFVVNDAASDTSPFVINAFGDVGIGVTFPTHKLSVDGSILARAVGPEGGQIDINNPDNSSIGMLIDVSSSNVGRVFQVANNSSMQIGQLVGTGGNIQFYTEANQRMLITSSGRVQLPAGGILEAPVSTNAQTGTSYTLVLTDAGRAIEMNNASANTLTVPTDASVAFPVGTVIDIFQTGAGQTTVGGAGVTINARPGLKLSGQWATATLIKRATNTWLLTGSLSA
jgi:hypothetical protein